MRDTGALSWSLCKAVSYSIRFWKRSSSQNWRQERRPKQLSTPFLIATSREFYIEISNQKICFCNQKTRVFHHSKLPILVWLDSLKMVLLPAQPVVRQVMLPQKCSNRNHMVRSATSGVLALLRLSCFREHLHFMRKIILPYSNKSKHANMTLRWKHGTLCPKKQKISFQKFSLPIQQNVSQ